MNNEHKYDGIFLFALCCLIIIIFLTCTSCVTKSRREKLQEENPNCYVSAHLEVECPDPYNPVWPENDQQELDPVQQEL